MDNTNHLSKPDFIILCESLRADVAKSEKLNSVGVDLINYSEDFHKVIQLLSVTIYGKFYWDIITDYIYHSWNGEIYEGGGGKKIIEKITNFEELYEYIEKSIKRNGKL